MTQEMQSEDDFIDKLVKVTPNPEHCYYLDGIYKDILDNLKIEVLKKDYDGLIIFASDEGYGKSTHSFQTAMYLDPNFNLDKVVFTADQFIDAVNVATKGDCIVFDETMGYLGSRGAMSKFNRTLIKVFSEMRSKNLFIILNIPSFFELDKYPAIHRSIFMVYIYKRSYFAFFGKQRKKKLYIEGKKYYNYSVPADFIGRCTKYFVLNKENYNEKKLESIKTFMDSKDLDKKVMIMRNKLIVYLVNVKEVPVKEVSELIGLTTAQIYEVLKSSAGITLI